MNPAIGDLLDSRTRRAIAIILRIKGQLDRHVPDTPEAAAASARLAKAVRDQINELNDLYLAVSGKLADGDDFVVNGYWVEAFDRLHRRNGYDEVGRAG